MPPTDPNLSGLSSEPVISVVTHEASAEVLNPTLNTSPVIPGATTTGPIEVTGNTNLSGLSSEPDPAFPVAPGATQDTAFEDFKKEIAKVEAADEKDWETKREAQIQTPTHAKSSKDWEGLIKARIASLQQSIVEAPQEQFKTIPQAIKAALEELLAK
jgi:hypothetical protein